jgi:hypothetical protein
MPLQILRGTFSDERVSVLSRKSEYWIPPRKFGEMCGPVR